MKRTVEKHMRFSESEYAAICKKAQEAGMKPSAYIREMAVGGVIRKYDMRTIGDLRVSFNRIGTAINQIARLANSTKSVYAKDIEDMQKKMREFSAVMENYLTEFTYEEIQ